MSKKKVLLWTGIATLVFGLVVIGGLAFLLRTILRDACISTVTTTLLSPDGRFKAKLGYVNCGGTTDFQGGVHLERTDGGEIVSGILGFRGKSDKASLAWINSNTLVLGGLELEDLLWFRQDSFSALKVVLKPGQQDKAPSSPSPE